MAVAERTPAAARAERAANGREARSRAPRSSHAAFAPAPDRPDPVALLERQAATRVPELVPIRHGRMLASPFAFFRGSALVMATDLAEAPRTGLTVQLCGDAHLSNFGAFATPERRLVFDVNDFDETLPGPFEWDVKRLAASFEVAGRDRGLAPATREEATLTCLAAYRAAMAGFAEQTHLEVFYARLDIDETLARYRASLPKRVARGMDRGLTKARSHDRLQAFARLTRTVDGRTTFISDPPLVEPISDLASAEAAAELAGWFQDGLRTYDRTVAVDRRRLLERYRVVDVARKVVGVGSVGTRAWIALLLGDDERDPLILQLKEAQASVLEGLAGRSAHRNQGHRVVDGQRLMQAAGDAFLGWMRVASPVDGVVRDFYIRQLRDWKMSADVAAMSQQGIEIYARLCGWTLARAHARSGDPVAIAAYLGRGDAFDRAILAFAGRYADQNERDHAALQAAVASGRVEATTGL
jgi:uncharacterized protein (DUF2252 family)